MADATASATAGSRGAAFSMVAMTDLKTDLGSRFCITDLLKTFAPKTSPGASPTSKLAAGGTYASTSLIACRRTLLLSCSWRQTGLRQRSAVAVSGVSVVFRCREQWQ